MTIILGSSSPYRQEIMNELGLKYTILSPDIDEKAIRDINPEQLVKKISIAKAQAIQKKLTGPAIIITADQVISFNGEIREKPTSKEEARHFFQTYHLHPIVTINGITVTNTLTRRQITVVEKTSMLLNKLPKEIIDQLIVDEETYRCAGGMYTERPLFHPYVKENTGTRDSLYGLPKEVTKRLLAEIQVEPWYTGIILSGEQVGRTMSYPTTNFDVQLLNGREEGVYAVLVEYKNKRYQGALYFGPDYIKINHKKVLEIHLFNFSKTIYGEPVSFQLGKFIRPPLIISDPEVMKKQIENDITQITAYFSS